MAATSWDPLQPFVVDAGGGIAPIFSFAEAATQSGKAGSVVHLAAGGVDNVADAETKFLGIQQSDSSGTTAAAIDVQVWRPGDFINFHCVATTADVATDADNFSPGQTYSVAVDGNGVCAADLATTHATTVELVFVQPIYDATGASTTRGIFCLEGDACNLHAGSTT